MRRFGWLAAIAAAPAAALGQQPVRVDPGHADASDNAISFRRMEVDQRVPSGFEGVYQLSKVDALGRGQTLFMRLDNGITAVFPRSVYTPTPLGTFAEVPPGTVFFIGPPPQEAPQPGYVSRNFINLSAAAREVPSTPVPPVITEGSLITDEQYRQRRLDALMTRALGK